MPSEPLTSVPLIAIRALRKTYPDSGASSEGPVVVFDGLELLVRHGEFLTVFGPNGCGKTTLLHILAGLVPRDGGMVEINGGEPGTATIGFVFQSFQATLFPWKTNIDNVAWPLELSGISKDVRTERARRLLQATNVPIPEHDYPYRLSGGQQQLLSIARALIMEPLVLLMDEPFNQLDYQTRMTMQLKTLELWAHARTTVLFVSHDLDEALLLGDRTALLSKRPARVLEIIDNPLPRPRNHELLKSPEFFALRSRALDTFSRALAE